MVRIPDEYQEVEYLESTGTQYIATDIEGQFSMTFESDIEFTGNQDAYSVGFLDGNFRIGGNGYYGGRTQISYGSSYKLGGNLKLHVKYNYKTIFGPDIQKVFIDGELTSTHDMAKNATALTGKHVGIFARLNNDNGASLFSKAKMYNLKILDLDKLLGNFIPCYRKSDNEIGMYDTVSKTFFTNQGTGTFLKGNDVAYDTVNLMESRRRILMNTPHLESLTGSALSFKTDMASKLKECKIHFTPVQEGTGDPSPDNVRPISGWDSVDVTVCGKNLLNPDDENWGQYTITPTGSHTSETDRICTGYISCNEGETYTFSGTVKGSNSYVLSFAGIAGFDENKEYVGRNVVNYVRKVSYTVPSGVKYIRAFEEAPKYPNITMKVWCNTLKRQLELSSTATDYEPYQGQSLTIPFPQTIYGGYVDLVKGEVVETHTSPTSWTATKGGAVNQYGFITYKADQSYVRSTSPSYRKCNTISKFGTIIINNVAQRQCEIASGSVYVALPEGEDVNDIQVVYRVATPLIHAITPETIKALRGLNNLWSDANGNIEIKFWAH